MKPGTIVRLEDGREGTVVYHGLDGYGIVWGRVPVNVEEIYACTPLFENGKPKDNQAPEPEAMLRDPYPSAETPCVGENYVIIKDHSA